MTEAYLEELRGRVRSDRRAVTAPLLTFGALVVAHVLIAAAVSAATESAMATHLTALVYWPVAGAVGLFALWRYARHVAARDGVGEGPRSYRPITVGYLVSVPLLALLFVPVLFVGVFAPLVWPAAVLYAIAVKQHTTVLRTVAKVLAFAGCLGALAALSGNPWLFTGVELAGGLALLGRGLARR